MDVTHRETEDGRCEVIVNGRVRGIVDEPSQIRLFVARKIIANIEKRRPPGRIAQLDQMAATIRDNDRVNDDALWSVILRMPDLPED
jgi:hypothetical protein